MKTHLSFALAVLLSITGCSYYKIKSRTNPNVDLKKYNTIYVGWLDLGPERWATYNYATQKEWLALLDKVNQSAVPSYFKEAFPDKTVLISKTPNDKPPADSLYIKFTNAAFMYNDDVLSVAIHCIDGKSKQELSAISVRLKADYKLYYAGFSFDNRVTNSILLLATFIKEHVI